MASSSLLLPLGSAFSKYLATNHHTIAGSKIRCAILRCSSSELGIEDSKTIENRDECFLIKRRDVIGMVVGVSSLLLSSLDADGAGLPPEEKPRLCDANCEKELENVAANYVAMVPSGQIFDSSLEKGVPYIFRVGSGQVIKGLDEGILSMKLGGKRRLYIPGPV